MIANVLSIAGSDPSGGAGVQADLKTLAGLGCYGMAAITALTAQNTQGVRSVHVPPAAFLTQQLDAVFDDIRVDAVKIGMLATGEIVAAVAAALTRWRPRHVVLDPVLVATSGDSLGAPDVVEALRAHLFPLATLITPNLPEAARLTQSAPADSIAKMTAAGEALLRLGARAALIKGGHLPGAFACDMLVSAQGARLYEGVRIETPNTHGTGCTLSSAIAAALAQGVSLEAAVGAGKEYLTQALRRGGELQVGRGAGPTLHFHQGAF